MKNSRPLLLCPSPLSPHHPQPAYRGKQLYDALTSGVTSLATATSLPKAWRESLMERGAVTGRSAVHAVSTSTDGTTKFLLRLVDGHVIECVGIPERLKKGEIPSPNTPRRLTVCISSQVGCPMRCAFCATGRGGFARNLASHEIWEQALHAATHFGPAGFRVSNIVLMGMGEPLLNLKAVVPALTALTGRLGVGARKVTVSTVGVPQAIARLGAALGGLQVTLAVSIHAPTQALREALVPSAKAYPLAALLADCETYFNLTGRRVTFEYALLAGVNDAPEHAAGLARLLRRPGLRSHVNVIPFNPVDGAPFSAPSRAAATAFAAAVEAGGVPSSVRTPRGQDAAAACGQLRNEHQKTPLNGGVVVAA
jgi:23S rRNA (adenine2503-C2)-methyltransferase